MKEFHFDSDIQWQDLGNEIYRKIFGYDEKVMLVKMKFAKGAVGVLHEHHNSQASYIESGVFEMTIGLEKKIIQKGGRILCSSLYTGILLGFYISCHFLFFLLKKSFCSMRVITKKLAGPLVLFAHSTVIVYVST